MTDLGEGEAEHPDIHQLPVCVTFYRLVLRHDHSIVGNLLTVLLMLSVKNHGMRLRTAHNPRGITVAILGLMTCAVRQLFNCTNKHIDRGFIHYIGSGNFRKGQRDTWHFIVVTSLVILALG